MRAQTGNRREVCRGCHGWHWNPGPLRAALVLSAGRQKRSRRRPFRGVVDQRDGCTMVVLLGSKRKLWRDARQNKASLLSGNTPRGCFSRGAIALLRGPELKYDGFARLPDLLHGRDSDRHSFADHGDGTGHQSDGRSQCDGGSSSGRFPQRGAASASRRLAHRLSPLIAKQNCCAPL